MRSEPASALFTTAITESELLYGIALLPEGRRRQSLASVVDLIFAEDLTGRVLPFDSAAAREFAEIAASRRRAGRPISEADARVAAIARSRGAALATRNVGDFAGLPAGIDRSLGLSRQRIEHHHRAVDRGQGAVGAWWPGVSSRLKASPSGSPRQTSSGVY
jgi:predicted nucleic acid-binding protein